VGLATHRTPTKGFEVTSVHLPSQALLGAIAQAIPLFVLLLSQVLGNWPGGPWRAPGCRRRGGGLGRPAASAWRWLTDPGGPRALSCGYRGMPNTSAIRRADHARVAAGHEQGHAQALVGDPIAVAARLALDEPVQPQAPQLVRHLPWGALLGGFPQKGSQVLPLKEFFGAFFRCFFPAWAERFEFATLDWLDKELFLAPLEGEKRQLDLVARLHLRLAAPRRRNRPGGLGPR